MCLLDFEINPRPQAKLKIIDIVLEMLKVNGKYSHHTKFEYYTQSMNRASINSEAISITTHQSAFDSIIFN